jgi:hypothetical protein
MAIHPPVVVSKPSKSGGRRVHIDSQIMGMAYSLRDLEEFLRRAGLDPDNLDIESTELIEWRGGGPDVWRNPQ